MSVVIFTMHLKRLNRVLKIPCKNVIVIKYVPFGYAPCYLIKLITNVDNILYKITFVFSKSKILEFSNL